MLDLRRVVSPVRVLGSLVLAIGLSSFLIKALDPRWPEGLRPHYARMLMGEYQHVGQRLAGVITQARRNNLPPKVGQVNILLGSSAIKHAVDSRILDEALSCQWLNLGARAANIEDCYRLAELLYSAHLKIDKVVLGLHPDMLARNKDFLKDDTTFDPASEWKRIKSEGWRGAFGEIDRLFSVSKSCEFPNATRTNYRVREGAEMIRTSLLLRLGMGLESIYRPVSDPWTVAGAETSSRTTVELIDGDIAFHDREFGFFQNNAYPREVSRFRDLDNLIDLVRGKGSDLIVLIVPTRTEVRTRFPKEAGESLVLALKRHPELDGRVLDLGTSVPDAQFCDWAHLGKQGRGDVSRRLVDFIRSVKSDARPIQSGPDLQGSSSMDRSGTRER